MYLNKPPWSEDLLHPSCSSPSASLTALPGGVIDLVKSLNKQRLYREITLALRTTLRDATAEFSFLRVKGLEKLLKFLGSVVESENMIELFRETQTFTEFQVVPVLFHYSIAPSKSGRVLKSDDKSSEERTKIASLPTSNEVALALQVLEGCCLLDRDSRTLAQQHMAIKEIVRLLSAGSTLVQSACLDVLIALMLDSLENQKEFERHHGVRKVIELVKYGYVDEQLRCKLYTSLPLNQRFFRTSLSDHSSSSWSTCTPNYLNTYPGGFLHNLIAHPLCNVGLRGNCPSSDYLAKCAQFLYNLHE